MQSSALAGAKSSRRQFMEQFLTVRGEHNGQLTVRCPGAHLHTHPGEDATVFLHGVPTLRCFHQSCKAEVEAVNRQIWARLGELPDIEIGEPTPEELAEREFKKRLRKLARIAHDRVLPALDKVPLEAWEKESPHPVAQMPVRDQWRPFLSGLYPPHELVWIGEKDESGPQWAGNFRTTERWLQAGIPYGQQVSLCTFKPDVLETGERQKRWIKKRLYLVVECDSLSYEQAGGIAKWAQKFMTLRAVVDTGGKSLHCYFEPMAWPELPKEPPMPLEAEYWNVPNDGKPLPWPEGYSQVAPPGPKRQAAMDAHAAWKRRQKVWQLKMREIIADHWRKQRELLAILEGLGCDRAMLHNSLTARLPGHDRLDDNGAETGRVQRLLYLDPAYEVIL